MDLENTASCRLDLGHVIFSREATTVGMVLGSAVGVCIWDQQLRHGGACHFARPTTRNATQATPIYGNVALAALLRMFVDAGSSFADLDAQIVGGAAPADGALKGPGSECVQAARRFLRRKNVPIVSEDIGGRLGRKVIFDIGMGQVVIVKVRDLRRSDWRTE